MNAAMDLERARFNMIEQQIRTWDVLDLDVLALLSSLKREDFVPAAHRALAFVDMQVPLLADTEECMRKGWCMLEPKVEARLLQDVAPKPHEKVLEVGAGSGYMAALLARRADRVISLELHPELARMARSNLARAGISNVDVREADGARGLAAEGPFDVIVLSGSVAEVPHALLTQLKPEGRLVIPLGEHDSAQQLTLITRNATGHWVRNEVLAVRFVPLVPQ